MESLVLVPIGVAMWQLGGKIQELRARVTAQDEVIAQQQTALAALATANGSSGGGGMTAGPSLAFRVAAWSGAAVSASLVAVNVARLMTARQRRADDIAAGSRPPANYAPQPSVSDETACVACIESVRDTLIQPCGHFALCWGCAAQMKASDRPTCPMCRGPMEALVFAFHA